MTPEAPSVAIVIVTRNRLEELRRALESCLAQSYAPLQVHVYDDASETPVEGSLKEDFPQVLFQRASTPRGYIAHRHEAFHQLESKYIFWLDDDAYYTSSGTVAQVVEQLERQPRLAAMALPFVEPLKTPQGQMRHPGKEEERGMLKSFTGCAVALRRSAAVEAGGLRTFFFIYGEERDLAIRLIERGHGIGYAKAEPIVHMASPKRNKPAQDFYSVRNTLLFDFLNLPVRYAGPAMLVHTVKLLRYKLTPRALPHRLWAVAHGWAGCVLYWRHRAPVSVEAYKRYRSHPAHGPEPSNQAQAAEAAARR